MSAPLELDAFQYVASFGKDAALGCFTVDEAVVFERGDQVILETGRGHEVGRILCPASIRQARLLGAQLRGRIVRSVTAADAGAVARSERLGAELLERARNVASADVVLLDADVFLDGRGAMLQVLATNADGLAPLVTDLSQHFGLDIRLANLAEPMPDDHATDEATGCGKPDCGQGGGGSCTSCSSGGCSTGCGAPGGVDIRPYFAHLREQMEASQRVPLI